jgi:hypothetical protein
VVVSGIVTINRLGSHPGNGEAWADREHAVTAAEAQAFKRSCVGFGLGRYLYRFREVWVSLNRYGEPISTPVLPDWALPPGVSSARQHQDTRGSLDQQLTAKIESFLDVLGEPIYTEVLIRSGHSHQAALIPNATLQRNVLEWMESASRGFDKARALAERLGEAKFIAITDSLNISSMVNIASLETLKRLVDTLTTSVRQDAA